MMSINYSVTGKVEENWDDSSTRVLTASGGSDLDVQAEVDRIVSIVPAGTSLRLTIETVSG